MKPRHDGEESKGAPGDAEFKSDGEFGAERDLGDQEGYEPGEKNAPPAATEQTASETPKKGFGRGNQDSFPGYGKDGS